MPIHLKAEPGEYAEAVLLPGDPLRAKYIAETYFDDVVQRNSERGLLGYSGTYHGKTVSVQGTGMGCPGATIVFEELIQLGCTKLMRVGTCGGLQAHHALGGIGKVQDVHGGCLLTVSDIVVEGVFTRISDDELRGAVDRMTRVALATVTSDH